MKFFINNLKINILLIIFLSIKGDNESDNNSDQGQNKNSICTLTRKPSQDPFPSLAKCYKYNNEACCMSVHDEYIDGYINSILSEPCIRKYSDFENLMCFGCHPLENRYIDHDKKLIRICRNFALNLWNGPEREEDDYESLNKPTTIFDNCGFKVDLEILSDLTNENYIIPSEKFSNFYEFFDKIRIPFYEDYNITIQNDTDDNCYNNSIYINNSFLFIYLIIIFLFLL